MGAANNGGTVAIDPGSDDTMAATPHSDATLPSGVTTVLPDHDGLLKVDPDHYVDRIEITRGGMGRILAARDRRLRRKVAIKEMRAQSPEMRARFEREVLLTARLQHPSIVGIHEAGRWPSGEPFYAMRLVPGHSLDQVVAKAGSLDERIALLPHVLAVADALAYAHQERVIHRDLKPHNVLVGEFGETVVIDWGLAKELGSGPDEVGGRGDRVNDADVAATEVGDVLGTPAYMPPEQAEGAAVDERADVYAIGAILYHLLSGRSPYTGASGHGVLEAVKQGPPTPLAERQPGVPPDLLAIIDRSMARSADDRYVTARELAADLRRFQSGQLVGAHRYSTAQLVRRWLRRHRTAVSVGAIAVVALTVVGALSLRRILREEQRADNERRTALIHRANAEELMSFMLGDLREKLEPVGKLELLGAVALKARDYYASRPDTGEASDRGKLAQARQNVGLVLAAQGDPQGALMEYRAALALREQLVAEDRDNRAWQRDLSTTHIVIGETLQQRLDDPQGGLAAYRTALAIRERLAAMDPSSTQAQRDLSVGHYRVGEALRGLGDVRGALAAYQADLEIAQRLAKQDPNNATWQRDLSVSHGNVASIHMATTDYGAALKEYAVVQAIVDGLAARDPSNQVWQHDAAWARVTRGYALILSGEADKALVELEDAKARLSRLIALDPSNAVYKVELADVQQAIGDGLVRREDLEGALKAQLDALALREKLAPDRSNPSWYRAIGAAHAKVGDVHWFKGDKVAALGEYRAALEIVKELAAGEPRNPVWQGELGANHSRVADVLLALGSIQPGLEEWRIAIRVAEYRSSLDPGNLAWRADVLGMRDKYGDALLRTNNPDAALAQFRELSIIAADGAKAAPNNPQWTHAEVVLQSKVADLFVARKDFSLAEAAITDALAAAKRHAEQEPTNPTWKIDVAVIHGKLGAVLEARGDSEGAVAANRAALAVLEKHVAASPDDVNAIHELAATHERIGTILLARSDRAGALQEYDLAAAALEKLLQKAPDNAAVRTELTKINAARASCCR
jgi:tetratricopeptide (TPR) repeat protein